MWTYFTDMFDFLTLSVVIDDRIFCVHGGESLLSTLLALILKLRQGLSPSIHSIDQIKVVDRFRGTAMLPPFPHVADLTLHFSRNPTRGSHGGSRLVRPRRRKGRLCNLPSRCWVHLRCRRRVQVPQPKQTRAYIACASTVYGGFYAVVRPAFEYGE